MRINLQILDFNIEKINSSGKLNDVDLVTIGDFSCYKKNILSLNRQLLDSIRKIDKKVMLQLPIVVKENELPMMKEFADKVSPFFDGFVTGDLGLIKYLGKFKSKEIIYTTNVTNRAFSKIIRDEFNIGYVRPLMYKRTFIGEKIDFPKDVVIYGNMMINCATFCYYSKDDLVENCRFGCRRSRSLVMNDEKLHLVGRSLITENRFDIIDRIDDINDMNMATIMDYNLEDSELRKSIRRIKERVERHEDNKIM